MGEKIKRIMKFASLITLSGVHSMMLPNGAGYGSYHGYGQQTFQLPPANIQNQANAQAQNPQAMLSQLSPAQKQELAEKTQKLNSLVGAIKSVLRRWSHFKLIRRLRSW